ncbi:uncharacterized protein [Haliotis cracherodii]|uniref:uncharacterized protein n=1 Tax=Haliotis cracherodii TaxID=6455 RepID=UPI0039E93736
MAFGRIMISLFLLIMIKEVRACGTNSALRVVEMCKGGSTTARHFYLHGSPAGDVQRCDCSLTITGAQGSVYFAPVPLIDTTATCGGTLTLSNGGTRDCTRTSRLDEFLYPGTTMLSFAYNTADVRCCVEVKLIPSATNINITCPGSATTPTQSSPTTTTTVSERTPTASTTTTSALHADKLTFSSTSTPSANTSFSMSKTVPMSTPSTMTSSSESQSTSYVRETQSANDYSEKNSTTVASQAVSSFPGSFIAGWVTVAILVAVIVVMSVLLIRKQRESNFKPRDTCQKSVSTETDGGSIYEGLDRINVTIPDTMYERLETQPAEREVKDYYNIEMDGYANP